jgi:hypothetical protein
VKWILVVLVLIITGYSCEIALAALAISQLNKTVTKANLQWSFVIGTFGVTQSVSFAIFAFKYFEASKTISFAQDNVPYKQQQDYFRRIWLVRTVVILNLSFSWFMMNYFFYES